MIIDKSKLQPLLWAVVGAWNASDQDLHLHTDALDEFLSERTLEEVALGLLADIERLELIARISCNFDGYKAVLDERDQLKAENEALRKQIADLWPLKNVPPQDFRASNKCLACGDYHHGLGNLPCPRCTPVAQSAMAKEANHG